MKYKIIFIFIIFNSCTDMLINDETYKSICFRGGSWIEFQNDDIEDYLNNDFSLQLWISGNSNSSNDGKAVLSILDNNNSILFGLFRNTSADNALDIYLEGELIETITNDNLNWSKVAFNFLTITSESLNDGTENTLIKVFINDTQSFQSNPLNFNIGENNLIFGARVNTSQTYASNFWMGLIDEIRLWDYALNINEIAFHMNNPSKLNISNGCSNSDYTNLTSCEEAGETWYGTYSDDRLTNLVGLWRFNYDKPKFNILDESCQELNLDSGITGDSQCDNINGIIYTLPGYSIQFSKIGA